ncbi:MAG: hypothetical protein IJ612_07975 [Prevotella sp.]|nr:hypothetical protein [Prevotella sp.]
MRKPRPFNHRPIYIDAQRDRLAEIEQRARRELGFVEPEAPQAASLLGVFSRGQKHVNRRRERGQRLSLKTSLLLIFILLLIWKLLL